MIIKNLKIFIEIIIFTIIKIFMKIFELTNKRMQNFVLIKNKKIIFYKIFFYDYRIFLTIYKEI